MRQLLNTLFVTSEDIYLSLDGENVVANRGGEAVARYPLHTLQSLSLIHICMPRAVPSRQAARRSARKRLPRDARSAFFRA